MSALHPALSVAPKSYHDVLYHYQTTFAKSDYQPFVWPYRAMGPNLLVWYLLLPPTKSRLVFYLRYPVLALIIYFSVEAIIECRSPMVTTGYGIGLLNAWVVLWSATLVIFTDARSTYRRIERGGSKFAEARIEGADLSANGAVNGSAEASGKKLSAENGCLRARKINPSVEYEPDSKQQANPSNGDEYYVWQSLPAHFLHRLDWVADLVSSFRGPRWSHQIAGLAPPPSHIQASLKDETLKPPKPDSHLTRTDLLRQNLPWFMITVIALDGLKTLAMQDPYFWS